MSSYEIKLISKAAQGNAEKLLAEGIEEYHFHDLECKEVWEYLVKHLRKYKAQPSFEEIRKEYPDFNFEVVQDTTTFVKDKFIEHVKKREARTYLMDLAKELEENREAGAIIDELFLEKAKQLSQVVPSQRISRLSTMRERIQRYKERKQENLKTGILFGIPPLDEVTLGIQPHEYVTISGFTSTGKSSLMLYMLLNAYLEEGSTPMLVSLEMDEDQIYRKIDTMVTKIAQWKFKTLQLEPNDIRKWEEWAERAEKAKNDFILIDLENASADKIYAETSRWNPDLVAVDYLQLLRMPTYLKQSWQQVGELARSMKQMAKQLKVPVIALSQTNTDSADEGALLKNLAESRAIGHHSDIVLGLHSDEEMQQKHKLELRVNKNRDGNRPRIPLYANFATMEFRPWTQSDEMQRVEPPTDYFKEAGKGMAEVRH